MPKYLYVGPPTAIALPPETEGGEPTEIQLSTHCEVELPEGLAIAERLIKRGLLTVQPEPETPKRRSTKTTEEGNS